MYNIYMQFIISYYISKIKRTRFHPVSSSGRAQGKTKLQYFANNLPIVYFLSYLYIPTCLSHLFIFTHLTIFACLYIVDIIIYKYTLCIYRGVYLNRYFNI